MRVQMNLCLRKVCGDPMSPDVREEQDKLHHITLQCLSVHIAYGLDVKYILGSDQFGMHLFPQTICQWVEKGPSEVKGCVSEDKSQYTGDLVHNDSGERDYSTCHFCLQDRDLTASSSGV
jgi:hypothetical protein